MDREIMELVRAFEGAAKKMEAFDETVLGFGQILENLQNHLDELIEMVQLEKIVELSNISTQKLLHLSKGLDEVLTLKTKTITQADLLAQAMIPQSMVAATGDFSYLLEEGVLTAADFRDNTSAEVLGLVKKLEHSMMGVFALAGDGIYLLEGKKGHLLLESPAWDFYVFGTRLLYLVDHKLYRYHLLLKTHEPVMENVSKIELIKPGYGVAATTLLGETVIVPIENKV